MSTVTVGTDLDSAKKLKLKAAILQALRKLPPDERLRIPTRAYKSVDAEKNISADSAFYLAVCVRELLLENPSLEAQSYGESVSIAMKRNIRAALPLDALVELQRSGLLYGQEQAAELDLELHGGFPDTSIPNAAEKAEQDAALVDVFAAFEDATTPEPAGE
jgi:hypothetical protein